MRVVEIIDPRFKKEVDSTTATPTEDKIIVGIASRLDTLVAKAQTRGLEKMEEQRANSLAISLQGGAGKAHKAANVENALPPLRLVIPPTEEHQNTEFVTIPIVAAKS